MLRKIVHVDDGSPAASAKGNIQPNLRTGRMTTNRMSCLSQLLQMVRKGDRKKEAPGKSRSCAMLRILLPWVPLVSILFVVLFFSSSSKRDDTPFWKYHQHSAPSPPPLPPQQLLTEPYFRKTGPAAGVWIECLVSTDVRGNLGPAAVLLNHHSNTEDWLRDRWQAASDMHGTNIRGPHWVHFTWKQTISNDTVPPQTVRGAHRPEEPRVVVQRMELDWEAAYSDHYDVQIRNASSSWQTIFSMRPAWSNNSTATGGTVVVSQWGQSPGVTFPTPLHVLHNITLEDGTAAAAAQLRLMIYTSATGWGVSLWQVQIYGYYVFAV